MNKVIEYLEKYVQWLAMALGVAWLGWMVWAYLINSPASVKIKGNPLNANSVDPYIRDNPDHDLEEAKSSTTPVNMVVPDMTRQLYAEVNGNGQTAVAMTNTFDITPPVTMTLGPSSNGGVQAKVAQLPAPPAAVPLVPPEQGRSTVALPAGVLPPNGQTAAAPGAVPAGPAAAAQLDTDWVTVFAKVPMNDLGISFTKAFPENLAAAITQTEFLDAELVREELAFGTWGEPKVVDRLLNQTPGLNPPLPDEKYPLPKDINQQKNYIGWANQNTTSIIEPPFYQVIAGDPWLGLQAWEKKLVANAEAALAPAAPAAPVAPPPGPAPRQPTRNTRSPNGANQSRGASGRAGGPGGPNGPRPNFPPGAQRPPQQPVAAAPNTPIPGAAALPSGALDFDPAQAIPVLPTGYFNPAAAAANGDALIFLHDTSATPGKTYRYMIRYSLLNPMFGKNQFVAKPALAAQFTLDSPADGAWTKPVQISPRVFFVVSAGIANSGSAHFDVYAWSGGKWLKETFTASPGDEIGGIRDGHDFSTGWTLVDLPADRAHGGDHYALVVQDDGLVKERDARGDAQPDSEANKMLSIVNAQGGAADASLVDSKAAAQ